MKKLLITMCVLMSTAGVSAQTVTLPNQFQAGQPARAADVNANFETLRQAINRGFGIFVTQPVTSISNEGTSVTTATCPANTLVMSVNCGCDSSGSRNLGVLFSCDIAGNGGVVGCYLEAGTYNPSLLSPRGRITAQCLGAIANDGSRIPTGLIPIAGSDNSLKTMQTKSAETLAGEIVAAEQRARTDEVEQRRRLGR